MIASVRGFRPSEPSRHRRRFLAWLPPIRKQARFAFRRQPRELRQEPVAEAVVNACAAFQRLVARRLNRRKREAFGPGRVQRSSADPAKAAEQGPRAREEDTWHEPRTRHPEQGTPNNEQRTTAQ